MIEPEFWEDKGMLFVRVAGTLLESQKAITKPLAADDERRLREVSEIFYSRNRKGSASAVEASAFLYKFAKQHGPIYMAIEYINRFDRAVSTINAIIVGQRPNAEAAAEASALCSEISNYILALGNAKMRHESNDD